jgi:hypothetical protein
VPNRRWPSRRSIVAAFCALPLAARAQPQTATPEGFLRAIYEPYLSVDFKGQPYWEASRFFTPELAKLMEDDMREAKRRAEIPKLDGDPFLDAQDWEIKNLAITVEANGAKAVGRVSFDNFDKRTEITLNLVQLPAGWRIADIKAPSGKLSALYK